METKLLPCPFCGGEAELYKGFEEPDWYKCHVGCSCGATMFTRYGDRDETIEAWNRRANDGD